MQTTQIIPSSSRSERIARRVSSWILLAALLVFVLPFVSVSCATPAGYGSAGGGVTAKYTGIRLAVGGEPTLEVPDGVTRSTTPVAEDRVPWQPLFAVAIVLIAAAVLASDRMRRGRATIVTVLSGIAAVAALLGLSEVDRFLTDRIVAALTRQGNPRLATTDPASYVNLDVGFLVLATLLAVTIALNAIAWARGSPRRA